MTKERKIEILKDLLIQLSDSANILCTCEADERCEVVEECIKALEQQPGEDCVSRQAVFETIDDCNSDGLKGIFCSYDDGERFKEYIKKLPPVTPTQKDKYEWLGEQFKKMDAEFMQTLKGESNNG